MPVEELESPEQTDSESTPEIQVPQQSTIDAINNPDYANQEEKPYYGPESTTKEPPTEPPSEEGNVPTEKKVTAEEQAHLAPKAAGSEGLFAAAPEREKQTSTRAKERAEKRRAEIAKHREQIRQSWKEYQEKRQQASKKGLEAKERQAKRKLARQAFRKVLKTVIIDTFPVWGPIAAVVVVVLAVIAFVIGIAIAISLAHKGDTPPLTNPTNLGIPLNSADPEGTYLRNMSGGVYELIDKQGHMHKLAMDGIAGGWVTEHEVSNNNGKWCWTTDQSRCIPLTSEYNPKDGSRATINSDEAKFYVDMRWPYVQDVGWPDSRGKHGPPIFGYSESKYYGGRRVIVYNKTKNVAAVGIIGDWGPEPAFGVCVYDGSNWTDQTQLGNKRNTGDECTTQKAEWQAPGRKGLNGNFAVPNDYTGAIIGGSPALASVLKVSNNDVVIVGFAKDQTLNPGNTWDPVPADLVYKVTSPVTTITGNGGVPGVEEGSPGECGNASVIMMALYYIGNHGQSKPAYNTLPPSVQKQIDPTLKPHNPKAWYVTRPFAGVCAGPGFLNNLKDYNVPHDWNWVSVTKSDTAKVQAVIKSVQAGNPVLMYSAQHGVYDDSIHVYVLVGYDASASPPQFIVNNPTGGWEDKYGKPSTGTVEIGVEHPNGKAQTIQHLLDYNGEADYGHTFLIESKYLKQ